MKRYEIKATLDNKNFYNVDTLGVDKNTTIEKALRTFQTTGAIKVNVIEKDTNETVFLKQK